MELLPIFEIFRSVSDADHIPSTYISLFSPSFYTSLISETYNKVNKKCVNGIPSWSTS